MARMLRNFWEAYGRHLKYQMYPFEAIVEDEQVLKDVKKRNFRWHYLVPFGITAWIVIDTLVMWRQFGNNPEHPIFFHHMIMIFMPTFFMNQGDISFAMVYFIILLTNLLALFDKFPHINFMLLFTEEGSPYQLQFPYRKAQLRGVGKALTKKLMAFHRSYLRWYKKLVFIMTMDVHVAFSFPLVIHQTYAILSSNFEYLPSPRMVGVAILCPIFFRTYVSACEYCIHFVNQNTVIHIKQKHYLSNLNIDGRIGEVAKNSKTVENFRQAYQRWRKTMGKVLDLTREVEAFNKFYKHYMTVTFISFGANGCSNVNAFIQGQEMTETSYKIQLSGWLTYGTGYWICLFIFNAASSQTIWLNVRLFKRLRQFQMKLISGQCLSRLQVVKLDLVNEYKLLMQKCSFRLSNSQMINNKLFAFQIFTGVSVFYMKLIQDGSSEKVLSI